MNYKKIKNKVKFFIIFFLVFLFVTTHVFAQNDPSEIPLQRHLVIATTDNGPISIDRLLYFALRDIRYSVDFVMPIVREGYIQANEGTVDGVIAGYPNLHSVYTNLIQVPVPLEHINVRVFAREGSERVINSWDELSGLRVGILENRTYILERLPPDVIIIEGATNRSVLDGIVNGDYDVAVLAERDHETLGERLNIVRIGQVDQLTEYLYLHNTQEEVVPFLSATLERMFIDGSADHILNDMLISESNQRRTIVHIISSSIELGREDQFSASLRGQFENDMSIEWMTVNLDAKRFTRGQYNMAHIASLLRADCVSRNIAAVIVSGDTALDFLKDYYYLFFRNVPVLFYGVSDRYGDIIQDNEYHFTGIVKNIEAYETVLAALAIFPDTENIYVINDYTDEGVQYRNAIESELISLGRSLNIEYNENLNNEALLSWIGSLPENSLIIFGSYFVDAEHQYFSTSEMRRLLERSASLPILSVYSTEILYNAIGGKVLDYERYGLEIASMLRLLLDGSRAEDIPVVNDSRIFNRWIFDQIQMDRFNVSSNVIPAGSVIINGVPSIRESNPQFFIAMIILVIAGVLLIIGTGVFIFITTRQNRLKDKLQKELTLEKSTLETIFNSVPELLYVKDLNLKFIRVNKKFTEHFGCSEQDIIGKRSTSLNIPQELIENYEKADRIAITENRFVILENYIPAANGTLPYFEVIKTPLYNDNKIFGVLCIAYDISHRKEMEEVAQSASRAKSNFLANMSHEMRTPLTAVLGLTELTLETVHLDDETQSNLVKVYRAGETLLYLVNDILDISKIEANKFELNPHEYEVPSLLNDAITQSILYIGEKPIELILNMKEDLPNNLYGDELRIRQILNNLLSNAFKFTKEGTVELGIRHEKNGDNIYLTMWVSDTGIGIRQEDMGRLFTIYSKMEEDNSEKDTNRRTEGTGLGLSISKRVAEMMGGSINVESEFGKGSTFTVKIIQKYVCDKKIGEKVVESLKKFHYSIHKFEEAKMIRLNMSYARVLIVDDNPTNLDVAKGLMNLYGMKIDCVTGGQQAVDAIRNNKVKYNAIFMDHMMPEIDGIEATRIIREEIDSDYARNIPIIALTANAIVGNEEMFLSKGFQAFISKPIDLLRLDDVLKQWVRDKEAESKLPEKKINIERRRIKDRRISYKNIPGLDIKKGIAHFGFNEDTYFNVLRSYSKNTRPLLESISDYKDNKKEEYKMIVHGIKGSSYGIFAEMAGQEAEMLENACISGDINYIMANNSKLGNNILKLINDIDEFLINEGVGQKATSDKPDFKLLEKLLEACSNYDIDEIDAAMTEIDKFEYISDEGLGLWLQNNINQGKYIAVKDKLLTILSKTES